MGGYWSKPEQTTSPSEAPQRRKTAGNKKTSSLTSSAQKNPVKIKNDYLSNDYFIQYPSIGKGSFGQVFKVIHKITGMIRAAKKIDRSMSDENQLMNQYVILRKLQHPNIIKIYEIYLEDKFNYIVTDFCQGGQLFDRLAKHARFPQAETAQYMYQLMYGINYCHFRGIIHGDLKPQNILLVQSSAKSHNIKIGDFGASRFKTDKSNIVIATCHYRAPEVFKGKFTQKADIWACGVIMYNLLVGYLPFKNDTPEYDGQEIKAKILKGVFNQKQPYFEHATAQAKDLINKMLEMDPSRRISASQALQHPWFGKFIEKPVVTEKQVCQYLNNIKKYVKYTHLERLCLLYINNFMSDLKDNAKLLKVFKIVDNTCRGVVGKAQIIAYKQRNKNCEVTQKQMEQALFQMGMKQKGVMSFMGTMFLNQDFQCCTIPKQVVFTKDRLSKLYTIFDKGKTGKVTAKDMFVILGGGSGLQEEITSLHKEQGEQIFSRESFIEYMCKK